MAPIVRFVLFLAVIALAYFLIKYLINPKRKLELAFENEEYFLYDNKKDVKRKLLLTYKGLLLEGEKVLGTAEEAFRVIHIKMSPPIKGSLHDITKKDFEEIERKLFKEYPYATIEWSSPIKELLSE
jgi:hypothetical protein